MSIGPIWDVGRSCASAAMKPDACFTRAVLTSMLRDTYSVEVNWAVQQEGLSSRVYQAGSVSAIDALKQKTKPMGWRAAVVEFGMPAVLVAWSL